jgi:hypothetical protein
MKTAPLVLGLSFLAAASAPALHQAAPRRGNHATIDPDGAVYVSSDSGALIKMAPADYCNEVHGAVDQQTLGCRVAGTAAINVPEPTMTLEIYRRNGIKVVIRPGNPIGEWRFWKDGEEVSVSTFPKAGNEIHLLYDSSTGKLLEKVTEGPDRASLPQWAKDRGQLQDESVPESAELDAERTEWIAKVMREIGRVKPGMRRSDLSPTLTGEGGLSTRSWRVYVYRGCAYIHVRVEFTPVDDSTDESPNDTITSISTPFLVPVTVD